MQHAASLSLPLYPAQSRCRYKDINAPVVINLTRHRALGRRGKIGLSVPDTGKPLLSLVLSTGALQLCEKSRLYPLVTSSNLQIRVDAVNKTDSPASKSDSRPSASGKVTEFGKKRRLPPQLEEQQKNGEQSLVNAIPKLALKQLKDSIDQLPEINATRVVQLHQRIMASEYVIDLDRLTDKLLTLEGELFPD